MTKAKCTSCGSNIEVDPSRQAGVCQYCGSAYVTEKAIEKYNSTISNTSNNNANTIVNNYNNYSAQPQGRSVVHNVMVEPRPKIKWGLAILGFIFYIFPGVIYVAYISKKQQEWDKKYSR